MMTGSKAVRARWRGRAAMVGLGLSLVSGCGSGEPGLVKASGKVALDGGPWPTGGTLNFSPVGVGTGGQLRPASGAFGTDGQFVVTSFQEGDGLYPGTYEVAVDCWTKPPGISGTGEMIPGESPVPERYRSPSTSGFKVEVEPGSRKQLEFDVKTP